VLGAMARKRVTANGYRRHTKMINTGKLVNTERKLRPRLHSLQVVLAGAALGAAGTRRHATSDVHRLPGKIIFSLLGWLLLITVMILAIVTPIWFSAAGRRWRPSRPCCFGQLRLLSRGAPSFGDAKLGALLGSPQR
jgi:hypothetical protein